MLDPLADTQDLARRAELLLHGVVGVDGRLGTVGAVQVPGVEAREVLQGAEDFVTADWLRVMLVLLFILSGGTGLALRLGMGCVSSWRLFVVGWTDTLAECRHGHLLEDGIKTAGSTSRTSRRDKAQVVRQSRVVDQSIRNHIER